MSILQAVDRDVGEANLRRLYENRGGKNKDDCAWRKSAGRLSIKTDFGSRMRMLIPTAEKKENEKRDADEPTVVVAKGRI